MLSSVNKLKPRSYIQVAKPALPSTTISLLHDNIIQSNQTNDLYPRIVQARLYPSARSKGAILFDITTCKDKYTDQQCMIELKKQHPLVYACVPLTDSSRRYLEVYTSSPKKDDNIFTNGLVFEESKIRALPCRAVDDAAKIVTLKLTHLPMFQKEEEEVVTELTKSLEMFGEILDLGIATEKKTGLFMGVGYVDNG